MTSRTLQPVAQADLLLLIADLLRPPENITQPLGNLDEQELKSLVCAAGLPEPNQLLALLNKAIQASRRTSPHEWSDCYRALFDGAVQCPITEATYIRRDKGAIIGDVCGFYRAFGWNHVEDSGERPDHLLVELEFVAMLLIMSARAETEDQRIVTVEALDAFTQSHLNDWIGAFCDQLHQSTNHPIYVAAADLLAVTWMSLVQYHNWTVDPTPASTVGIGDEPDDPYECGAPDLVQLDAGGN